MEPYPIRLGRVSKRDQNVYAGERDPAKLDFTPLKNQMPRSISNIWGFQNRAGGSQGRL